MNSRTHRLIALPLAAVAAATALTGCGSLGRADEAAVVNGQVVPEADVQTAMREISADPRFAGKVTAFQVMQLLAFDKIAEPLARKHGVAMSEAQALEQLPEFAKASPATRETLRTSALLSTQMQQQTPFSREFVDAVQKADYEINPRYGAVDRSDPQSFPLRENILPWIKAVSLADKAATGQE